MHHKDLFQPVYPTEGGGWAGCGDPYKDLPEVVWGGRSPRMGASTIDRE